MGYEVRHKCAPYSGHDFLTLSWCYLPMSNYLRPHVAGACVFFTVGLANRRSDMLTREIARLRTAVRRTKAERPLAIDAWVVLPDHMHCVWTLPEGDHDFSTRWSVIKARFSRALPHTPRRASHEVRREHGLWQRRFWEHHLRTEAGKRAAIRYCWINPVKHGLVERPEAWTYSSIHRDGPVDWP